MFPVREQRGRYLRSVTATASAAAGDLPADPLASTPGAADQRARPLARLWHYAGPHRTQVRLAILFACLNKLFDVVPELLRYRMRGAR